MNPFYFLVLLSFLSIPTLTLATKAGDLDQDIGHNQALVAKLKQISEDREGKAAQFAALKLLATAHCVETHRPRGETATYAKTWQLAETQS